MIDDFITALKLDFSTDIKTAERSWGTAVKAKLSLTGRWLEARRVN